MTDLEARVEKRRAEINAKLAELRRQIRYKMPNYERATLWNWRYELRAELKALSKPECTKGKP